MIFYIDVENATGTIVGDGPITSASEWSSTDQLDRAGTFSFNMSASDYKCKYIVPKNRVRCHTIINGVRTPIGYGIIDKVDLSINEDGIKELSVSGDNIARELAFRSVGFLKLEDGNGGGISNPIQTIMALAPTGWQAVGETTTDVYASFSGESVLTALNKVAESIGEHFRILPNKRVIWFKAETVPVIRAEKAVNMASNSTNSDICFIKSISKFSDSYDMVNRIYPFGAGNGSERLDLYWNNLDSIFGYTVNTTYNYIQKDSSVSNYGLMEKYMSWKDISPISNSDNDLHNASNALLVAAWEYLKRYSIPNYTYDLEVFKVDKILYPGQMIQVVYRDIINGYSVIDINTNMYILEVTNKIDNSGIKTTNLKVATTDAWPKDDISVIASSIEEAKVLESHPQMNVCYYSENFGQFNIDSSNSATMTFKFDNEIVKLNNAKLRFMSDKFEATSKAVAGTINVSTSTDGGGNSSPSGEGGSQNGTETEDNHQHTIYVSNQSGGTPVYAVWEGGTTGLKLVANSSTNSGPVRTLTATQHKHPTTNHQHTIPHHKHTVTALPALNLDYGIYRDSQYPTNVTVTVDNVTIGTYSSISTEVEVEISQIINTNLRGVHTITFTCANGRGRIIPSLRCFVTVQSVILS